MQSQISTHISMKGYWWAGQFRGDKAYYMTSPLIDGYYQPDENATYLDNLQGSIQYNTDHIQLAVGRGKYQVGDNISGSIILNNISNDYGYLSSKLKFGTLSLSYLHGALTPDRNEKVYYAHQDINSVDSARVDKYIVMHKLDWEPSSHFNGFLGEEIIYGNRSLDFNYLMPHVFWRIIEHNLEDRDNVLVFGGFNWEPGESTLPFMKILSLMNSHKARYLLTGGEVNMLYRQECLTCFKQRKRILPNIFLALLLR